ncbi:Flippase-like domain-containing protein [Sphingomonas antarctica]|uniref:hypothetical protein n=1 Tax=Sphingomonas antarctica TaxID=2040274 RepID=UPI0039E75C8F
MPPSPQSSATANEWSAPFAPLDPEPLHIELGSVARIIGPLLSLAIFVAALLQFRELNLRQVTAMLPGSVAFWAVFATWYLTAPFVDWVIFRRLWRIPLSGLLPLISKLIGNDLLMGYVGEVYFYDWARRRANLATSPFGAVKDVAILSAIAGNAATLAMVGVAWPFANLLPLGGHGHELAVSIAVVLASSGVVMAFRGRLFSLSRSELRFIFAAQLTRIAVATALSALLWHLVLPDVALSWWLLLATIRLLISRLPFLPNKDVVFAGLAVVLVGHDIAIAELLTMLAGVILLTHLVVGAGLLARHFALEGKHR